VLNSWAVDTCSWSQYVPVKLPVYGQTGFGRATGMQIYLVGGAVRDALLGLKARENDWVVVGSTADELRELGYAQVGRDFPVFLHPRTHDEYALARTERKTGPGHKGFAVHADSEVSLEQDLQRRDLTINAIARDEHDLLIDPYGGLADIEGRILRHVSGAFSEDPLRVFRVARFYARFAGFGFSIADETQRLLRDMCASGALSQVSAERVWQELYKTLAGECAEQFFAVLTNCDGLEYWFPEIAHIEISELGNVWQKIDASDADNNLGEWQKYIALGWFLSPEQCLSLSIRLKVPKKYQRSIVQMAKYGFLLSKWDNLRDGEVLNILGSMGALKQSSKFEALLSVVAFCDATESTCDFIRLVDIASAVGRLSAQDVKVEKKLSGVQLGEAIRKVRLEYIHQNR